MTDPRQVTDLQARRSAWIVGAVLLAIAAWNAYKGRTLVWQATGGLGGLLALIGVVSARASRAFHVQWMRFASVLGWINSRIILSLVYFVVMTPVGLIGRMFGRDPLDRRGPKRDSYWVPRERVQQPPAQFERQF